MRSPPRVRDRRLIAPVCGGAVTLVIFAFVVVGAPWSFRTGTIRHHGQGFHMPVPFPSIRIGSEDGRAIYLALGRPDYVQLFSSFGPRYGWDFVAEDGGIFVMSSTDKKLWLHSRVDLTPLSTQMDFRINERSD